MENFFPDEMNIPGLVFKDRNGKIVFNPRPPIQNMDQLPYPDRQDIDLYKKKGIVTYVQGSRGCYGHCTFCYLNPFYKQENQWRGRSAKNIFDEILKLYTERSIEDFYFSDANFFGPGKPGKERAVTLAELILAHDLNIRFGFECRANDIEEYSLSRLVMAGLTNVFLGLESGDTASLKRFKNTLPLTKINRLFNCCGIMGLNLPSVLLCSNPIPRWKVYEIISNFYRRWVS